MSKTGYALGLLLALAAGPVLACPMLETGDPKVGSVVVAAVGQVMLTFSDAIEVPGSILTVTDEGGVNKTTGKAFGDPKNARRIGIHLTPLAPGKYKVTWRLKCNCGHPVPGTYKFTVAP